MKITWGILTGLVFAGAGWAQNAGPGNQQVPPIDGSVTQFIVIARDAETERAIEDFSLSLDKRSEDGKGFHEELRCSNMGDMVLVHLSRGHWQFRINAGGYDEEIFEELDITGNQGASQSVYAQEGIESFTGTTVAIPVFLKKSSGGIQRTRNRPLVNDTLFYAQTDVPPAPIGGIEALRKRIKLPGMSQSLPDKAGRTFSLIAFINDQGGVVGVQVTRDLSNPEITKSICQSVQNSRFTPAKILGRRVASRLAISFSFAGREK